MFILYLPMTASRCRLTNIWEIIFLGIKTFLGFRIMFFVFFDKNNSIPWIWNIKVMLAIQVMLVIQVIQIHILHIGLKMEKQWNT